MYLANDVIQNSRKKGTEFTKEFSAALRPAFEFMSKFVKFKLQSIELRVLMTFFFPFGRDTDEKTLHSLERIVNIWAERNIYEANLLSDFKKAIRSSTSTTTGNKLTSKSSQANSQEAGRDKRKREPKPNDDSQNKKPKSYSLVNSVCLLSQSEAELPIKGEDVNPEELIKSLQALQNTASCDAAIRERISKLPPEVSDLSLVEKIKDKRQMEQLSDQVEDAFRMLNEYNQRLTQELDDRKQVSVMLAAYHRYQRDRFASAEEKFNEYRERLRKVTQVKNELKSHLQNLPDLTMFAIAALPTPGDLFTSKPPVVKQTVDNGDSDSSPFSPLRPQHSPITSSPTPPSFETIETSLGRDSYNGEVFESENSYVPSARVKLNEAGGIATSYGSAFVP